MKPRRTIQKQNGTIYEGSIGWTRDSPNTPTGHPYFPDHPITIRGVPYTEILAQMEADKTPTSSPAVESGQSKDENNNVTGDGDWSPAKARGELPDEMQEHFDEDKARKDLLDSFTDLGKVHKQQAQKYFLVVDGNGQDPSDYHVPLAMMDSNKEPYYHPEALDAAWEHASGSYNGLANRLLQKKIVYIKQRNGIDLTDDQRDFTERHMSAYGVKQDAAGELLAYEVWKGSYVSEERRTAVEQLHKTLRDHAN